MGGIKKACHIAVTGRFPKGKNGLKAVPQILFALQLTMAAQCFCLNTHTLLGGLFVETTNFHFPKDAFTLHFLFEITQGLLNVIITYKYFHVNSPTFWFKVLYKTK